MNEELDKKIIALAPWMFVDYKCDPMKSCMAWGLSVGDGWYQLLYDMVAELAKLDIHKGLVADQVKEKFGGLRFYYHYVPDKNLSIIDKVLIKIGDQFFSFTPIGRLLCKLPFRLYVLGHFFKGFTKARRIGKKFDKIVNAAESLSYNTCEFCGKPGKPNESGWIVTLCPECRIKRDNR